MGIASLKLENLAMLSPDESCRVLTQHLYAGEAFSFTKVGDGAIAEMHGLNTLTNNCYGEPCMKDHALAKDLCWQDWMRMRQHAESHRVYMGHWLTAYNFGPRDEQKHEQEYLQMIDGSAFHFLHYECLLLNRELSPTLREFYVALREDTRSKLLVTSVLNAGIAPMLDTNLHLVAHPQRYEREANELADIVFDELKGNHHAIVLLSAGSIAGLIQGRLMQLWPESTIINLGSALDPVFQGRTRSMQVSQIAAKEFFAELLS